MHNHEAYTDGILSPTLLHTHTHTCAQTEEWSSRLGSEKGRLGSYGEITKDFLIWPNPIMNTEVDGLTDIKRDRGNILFVIRVK